MSYSLYGELTKFSESDQEKALDRVQELQSQLRKKLSIREFRKEIERLQNMDELPRDEEEASDRTIDRKKATDEVQVEIQIKLNKA